MSHDGPSASQRLSDEDIQRIAKEILRKAKKPEGMQPCDHILSPRQALPPEDEERVVEAIEAILSRRLLR